MKEHSSEIQEEIALWNRRASKDSLRSVMCSGFSEDEAILADQTQKAVITKMFSDIPKFNLGLELGSGFGRLSTKWLELATTLVAMDISEGMLKRLPNLPEIYPLVANLINLPLDDNTFDVIFISNVLGHLREDSSLLSAIDEVNRVAKRNCLLLVDEMVGQEGELVAGRYKIRNPGTLVGFLKNWSITSKDFYNFGRQPHAATILQRVN